MTRSAESTARRAYLVGTNFSGSTVFGQALGAAESVMYLGEIDRLVQFPPTMWVDELEPTCHYCELRAQPCPVWTPDRVAEVRKQPYDELMDFLQEEFGDRIMIDGSKHPHWLRTVANLGGLDRGRTVAFLTVRSPFAFCDSYRARTSCQLWEAANIWRDVNYDTLRMISRVGLPSMVVRYEDFARDPDSVLRPACALLGIPFEPHLRYFQQLASHDVGGSYNVRAVPDPESGRFDADALLARMPEIWRTATAASQVYWGKPFGGWVDNKWQANMADWELELVVQTPGLSDVANLLGYELTREVAGWQQRQPDRSSPGSV